MRPTPENQIRRRLARTAMLLRLFATARAVLLIVACMELFLWVSVGLDYFLVLTKGMRGCFLALAIITCSSIAVRTACLQVFRRIS
ncbi:MAG: hypothetical protein Q4G59_08080, partial [Planctomycetia bacterium]|nr:hypothetical protein [Planctomycetia bacterium]